MVKHTKSRAQASSTAISATGTAGKTKCGSGAAPDSASSELPPTELRPSPAVREFVREFMSRRDPEQAAHLMRFFKTGPGQYGEGDRFLGIKVPVTRALIKPFRDTLSLADFAVLLASEWHEIRLGALLLLAVQAKTLARKGNAAELRKLVDFYDRNLERANNWDLVDMSVRDIMEAHWRATLPSAREIRDFLLAWAKSGNLWRERAAMIATYARQRMGSLDETFWLAEYFLPHRHDLMHKACGWMLREAGKYDAGALREFLAKFHRRLPRTTLRYAIEHMDEAERKRWMIY